MNGPAPTLVNDWITDARQQVVLDCLAAADGLVLVAVPGAAALRHIDAYVCEMCLTSAGAECHAPGCVFWMHDVPAEDTADALRSAVEATS